MKKDSTNPWEIDKARAAGILRDRRQRRKYLGAFALVMLGLMALGLWGLDEWLSESVMRFAIYWLVSGAWCLVVMLFAVLDGLMTIREERDKS